MSPSSFCLLNCALQFRSQLLPVQYVPPEDKVPKFVVFGLAPAMPLKVLLPLMHHILNWFILQDHLVRPVLFRLLMLLLLPSPLSLHLFLLVAV